MIVCVCLCEHVLEEISIVDTKLEKLVLAVAECSKWGRWQKVEAGQNPVLELCS